MRRLMPFLMLLFIGMFVGVSCTGIGADPPESEQLTLIDADFAPGVVPSVTTINTEYQPITADQQSEHLLYVLVPVQAPNGMIMYQPYPIETVSYSQALYKQAPDNRRAREHLRLFSL